MPHTGENLQPPPVRSGRGWLSDLAFVALLAALWVIHLTPIVVEDRLRGFDIFRDVAYALNVQHGQLFGDPAYLDETIWYPPLSPAIMAGLATLFDVTPTDCYRWSQLLFNWTLPVGLFLVVRVWWGRRAAIAATIAFLLAMPWWQSEVAHGQPSIHSVAWGWIALVLYGLQHKRASLRWALGCGVLLGIAFWHHPFIPATLLTVFMLQTAWSCRQVSGTPDSLTIIRGLLQRNMLIPVVALAIAAPVLYLMLHGPVLNHEPREYIASELRTVEFALMRGNLWVWATGLVGLIWSVRRADLGCRLLVLALGVSLLCQVPGYARLFALGWPSFLPTFVPHEFQRMFQLGWAICVGIGIDVTLKALAARLSLLRASRIAASIVTLLALAATGAWGVSDAKANLRRFLLSKPLPPAFEKTADWIVENTDVNDVFACEPAWAFAWLNAETGRKVWITARGHSNPRIDWLGRQEVLATLLETSSPQVFWRVAREHGIDYLVPSPMWNPRILADPDLFRQSVPTYLTLVHGGPEAVYVFRVNPIPLDASSDP